MLAFDRDGTVIGVLGDFERNHPKHLKTPQDQKPIKQVTDHINLRGGILISNQQGVANGYTTLYRVISEFVHLHEIIPGLQGSFFCPDQGQTCWMVVRGEAIAISEKTCYAHLRGTFRKPQAGMFAIARDQFGQLDGYVGDLSGHPDYGRGLDSDLQAAINASIPYYDVQEFISHNI